jgi:multicomponent K+:H+ antiporter subunit D
VAALFMVMTKVGAYAILRIYTLVFGADAGAVANVAAPWVAPAAVATLVLGAAGVLASRTLLGLVCFAVVWSMGSLLVALGLFDTAGVTAGLYYLVHSTIAGAALFLLADLVGRRRGAAADRLVPTPPLPNNDLFSGLFFAAAIAMTGLPPLSGFLGKLLILDATRPSPAAVWLWGVLLATSLMVILGFARAGSVLFWKTTPASASLEARPARIKRTPVGVCVALLVASALLAAFAGPLTRSFAATAEQVFDTAAYVRAVLPAPAAASLSWRRP